MAANTTTTEPQDRTECVGCWDEDCAVCTDASTWKGHGSQTHGQLTYSKNLASDKQVTFLASLGMAPEDAAKLTKTEASAEIDKRLKAAPPRPMSDKQEGYLRSLMAKKAPTADVENMVAVINAAPEPRKVASEMIDDLRNAPTVQVPDAKELEDGIYRLDGTIYKVYVTVHGANQKAAKELVPVEGWTFETHGKKRATFEYRGKAPLRKLTSAHRLTLEQAQEFGQIYGMCCCCGATLTDETSIANGIGPVCAKRF